MERPLAPVFLYDYCRSMLLCSFEVPELSRRDDPPAEDLFLRVGVDEDRKYEPTDPIWSWQSGSAESLSISTRADSYLLDFGDSSTFSYVPDTRTLTIGCEPTERQRNELLNQVLPRVLDHQGRSLVHGAAVQDVWGTTVLMGDSGWGKSTLGAALAQCGGTLLSDDCVELLIDGELAMCRPTYRSLRLWADSATAVRPDGAYRRVSSESESAAKERFVATAREPQSDEPIRIIYFLNDPIEAADDVRIEPLSPALAVSKLIGCSFRLDPRLPSGARAAFDSAVDIANRVPTFALRYPRDYGQLQSVVETVTSHANKHGLDHGHQS